MKQNYIDEFVELGRGILHGYSEESFRRKERFHSLGKKVCRALADALGLSKGSYDVRSNKGGTAVAGEVTLHAENLYIQFSDCALRRGFMVRPCKGRKDYCGGVNNWVDYSALFNFKRGVEEIKNLLKI